MATAPPVPRTRAEVDDPNDLVSAHLDLVQHVVNRLAVRYPRHVDRAELWNAGALGLVDASRRYDPDCGVPFPRYALIRIRGAIIDSTRSRDWATRSTRRNLRAVRAAEDRFTAIHGRAPTSHELAEVLGIEAARLDEIRAAAQSATLLHLDQPMGHTEGYEATLGETLVESDADVLPDATLERRELTGTVRVAVRHLPAIQREVIERYYYGGEYLRSIADSLGLTEARVSQIRSEALTAMRAYFADRFEGTPSIDEGAPGRRARTAFLAIMDERSSWRSRLDAADLTHADLASVGSAA